MAPDHSSALERVVRTCRDFAAAAEVDLAEWLELSGNERLAIGEAMRKEVFGGDEQRLRRVLRIAEREEG
jgi:hypothetical protein